MKLVRGTLFLLGGISWIAAAFVFVLFLLQYVAQGAGFQFFALAVSSGSVLIGLLHAVGFVSAAVLCFVVGVGICAHGVVPPPATRKQVAETRCVADHFTVKFGEIGRTLEYSDVEGHIEFTFDVGSDGNISLSSMYQPSAPFDGARYEIAVERTKQYLQSQGFWVNADR